MTPLAAGLMHDLSAAGPAHHDHDTRTPTAAGKTTAWPLWTTDLLVYGAKAGPLQKPEERKQNGDRVDLGARGSGSNWPPAVPEPAFLHYSSHRGGKIGRPATPRPPTAAAENAPIGSGRAESACKGSEAS